MLCDIQLKKVAIDYSFYSKNLRVKCPFCQYKANHKTRVYRSLKSLLYHLSNEHSKDGNYYPFTLSDVRSLMKTIAKSLEWNLLG